MATANKNIVVNTVDHLMSMSNRGKAMFSLALMTALTSCSDFVTVTPTPAGENLIANAPWLIASGLFVVGWVGLFVWGINNFPLFRKGK